jgi:anti-sigma factor (TIGR02949 family)
VISSRVSSSERGTTRLLTCKQFLQELNEYLDDDLDPKLKDELRKHVNECPNCWVVCNTTEKTLKVYKGMEAKPLPSDIHSRLMAALKKKMADKCSGSHASQTEPQQPKETA